MTNCGPVVYELGPQTLALLGQVLTLITVVYSAWRLTHNATVLKEIRSANGFATPRNPDQPPKSGESPVGA